MSDEWSKVGREVRLMIAIGEEGTRFLLKSYFVGQITSINVLSGEENAVMLMFLIDSNDGQSGYPIDSPMSRSSRRARWSYLSLCTQMAERAIYWGSKKDALHLFINSYFKKTGTTETMNKLVLTFVFSYSAFFLQPSYAEDNFDFANTAKLVCEYGKTKRKSVCKDMVNQSIVAAVEIGKSKCFLRIAKNNGEKLIIT